MVLLSHCQNSLLNQKRNTLENHPSKKCISITLLKCISPLVLKHNGSWLGYLCKLRINMDVIKILKCISLLGKLKSYLQNILFTKVWDILWFFGLLSSVCLFITWCQHWAQLPWMDSGYTLHWVVYNTSNTVDLLIFTDLLASPEHFPATSWL